MAIITRSMAEHLAARTYGKNGGYPVSKAISFEETPCTLEEANAHLTMLAPHGIVVVATRGPKGGWKSARYTSSPVSQWLANHRSLHIGYAAFQISKESNDG